MLIYKALNTDGPLAQSVEHLTFNQVVGGSIPPWLTIFIAGWSNLVARQAHNLKVVGSNPAPATKFNNKISGGIAQAVEQWIENPRVASSNLAPTTTF